MAAHQRAKGTRTLVLLARARRGFVGSEARVVRGRAGSGHLGLLQLQARVECGFELLHRGQVCGLVLAECDRVRRLQTRASALTAVGVWEACVQVLCKFGASYPA